MFGDFFFLLNLTNVDWIVEPFFSFFNYVRNATSGTHHSILKSTGVSKLVKWVFRFDEKWLYSGHSKKVSCQTSYFYFWVNPVFFFVFFFTQHSLLQLCRSSHTEYTREQLVNICIDTWNSWILNDVIAVICKMLCIRCSKGIKSIFWSDQLYHSSTKCYYSIRYLVSSSIFYIRRINNCFLHDIADWRYIEK